MSWRVKSLLLFMLFYNVTFYFIYHFVVSKDWAMISFGLLLYIYGGISDIIDTYLKG